MVVRDPETLSAELLTDILQDRDFLADGHVESVSVSRNVFSGAIGELSRLEVTYSSPGTLPQTLLIKITKEGLHSEHLDRGRREVEFYASTIGSSLAIPICLDAQVDPESGHSHVIIEDLSGSHVQTTPPLAPSLEHCRSIVECLAGIHAHWWQSPDLGVRLGKPFDQDEAESILQRFHRTFPEFMDYIGPSLLPEQRSMYDKISRSNIVPRRHRRIASGEHLTVVHGDAHIGNFLLPRKTGRAVAIDWHNWDLSIGAGDLAFLIAHKWQSKRRSEHEMLLLRHYHEELMRLGINDYDWDRFWNDYRESVILSTMISVGQFRRKQHPALIWHGLECSSAAYHDLGCEELM
jgi:hypothetical protein